MALAEIEAPARARRARPAPVEDWRAGLSPAEQLRIQLAWAKQRQRPFELAWELAVSRIRWPSPKDDRDVWKAIIDAHCHRWQAAYEDMPESPRARVGLVL